MSSDEDINLPFNFDPFKKQKPLTKEQREYGIWADDNISNDQYKRSKAFLQEQERNYVDSSDDDEMLMRAGFSISSLQDDSKNSKNDKNFGSGLGSGSSGPGRSKFINFVSGGIKAASLKKDTQIVYDPKEEARLAEEKLKEKKAQAEKDGVTFISEDKADKGKDPNQSKPAGTSAGTQLGQPPKTYSFTSKTTNAEKMDKNFGNFDTSGRGMKLMMKMGFKKGQGLGKHQQGMINPIEQKMRKKGAGLGAAGSERTKQSLIHFPVKKDGESEDDDQSDEETDEKGPPKAKKQKTAANRWKKTKAQKPIYEIKSLVDCLSDQPSQSASDQMEIIDMTGQTAKVIQSGKIGQFSSTQSVKSTICPELTSNLNYLLELQEQDFIKKQQNSRNRYLDNSYYTSEEAKINDEIEKMKVDLEEIDKFKNIIERLEGEEGSLALKTCIELIEVAKDYGSFRENLGEESVFLRFWGFEGFFFFLIDQRYVHMTHRPAIWSYDA